MNKYNYHYLLKPEDKNKIQNMYQSGMTMMEIGNIYGVTRAAVSLYFKKHGIKARSRGEKKKEIKIENIFDVIKVLVSLHLKKYGIKVRVNKKRKDKEYGKNGFQA